MTQSEKLVIGYLYNKRLNLYGDNGNVEILTARAKLRGLSVEVKELDIETRASIDYVSNINLLFMGGGPDSAQKEVYDDLMRNKRNFIQDFIEKEGVGLYVCGSYQLLGKYYKTSDGSVLEGLNILGIYTEHFGNKKPRCIGNCVARLSNKILNDKVFINVNKVGRDVVGFENHGGRTYMEDPDNCFAKVLVGHGNNSEDSTEGYLYKNSIGTYFHGPILARNPHLADFLIAKSLFLEGLAPLDDSLAIAAHTASKKLKQ
jgi:hypothetical protein